MRFQLSGKLTEDEHPQVQSLISFMEASNELGTVKNQTILTTIPGLRKIPGHLKDLYDNVVDERDKLQKYFLDESQVCLDYSEGHINRVFDGNC